VTDTIGTNRFATIILDNNKPSRSFNLGTGRPQGDCTSPNNYNAGEQVLLFKIELDDNIISVYYNIPVPRNLFPADPDPININFRYESNCKTDKADGFADDASGATILEYNSINSLKNVLYDFAEISGLKCNFNKSCILPIGNAPVPEEIRNLGFEIVDEVTRIVITWERYKLSLPGRIGIYKTLLLSQIGYIGSICSPSTEMLTRIESLIVNFVLGNIKVAKDRLYISPKEGGLGLINIFSYLLGLQATWVKRAADSPRDNWRNDLLMCTGGKVPSFRTHDT
jgi:hypothetical protein